MPDYTFAPPTEQDIAQLYAIYSDPEVWRHLPSGRHTELEQTAWMVREWMAGWRTQGLSHWVVRDAASARVLGHVGCGLRRGCFWNLGYRIAPSAQGRGIATAGARKVIDAAHHTDPEMPVVAYLLEHNASSAHVARKVGLELQSRCRDAGNPDPQAMRLIFADRPLTAEVLSAAQQ